MKKGTIVSVVLCCLLVILHLGCGGGSSNTPKVSKLAKRAFVTVNTTSVLSSDTIDILDATKDQFSVFTITLSVSRATLVQPGASNSTLVFGSDGNGLDIVDNAKETLSNSAVITLPGLTESMAETSDAKTIYAAIRSTGQVSVVDVANSAVSTNISVPSVRRLALAHNNSRVLAFSDNLDTFTIINSDNTKACGPPDASLPSLASCGTLSRPFYGVFSSDDSKAYVLSCGPECGTTAQAAVTVVDLTGSLPNIGTPLPVSAGTVALMDSGNLYIAGTDSSGTGHLDIVNLSSFTVTKSIPIGNGFHSQLSLASNNKLFVGARTCTTGCLSIVDLSAGTAVISADPGDVTGIAPIPGRNVVYVTIGGELRIYDTTTSKPQNNQLNIVGTAAGVVAP